MTPDISPAEAGLERKPLSKLALIALRQLNEKLADAMQEILAAAAELDGVAGEEGWQFDPKTQSWVRRPA